VYGRPTLGTVQSNLILKDKKLIFEARKPFLILENTIYPGKPILSPIELGKNKVAQGRKTPLIFMRPYLLGDLDDVQTLQKIQAVAKRIYEYFRSKLARPP